MADFNGFFNRNFVSGPWPDPNVTTPKAPGAGDQPYPPGPFTPVGASPTIVPFERVGTFDLPAMGVDPSNPSAVGPAENGSVIAGDSVLINASYPSDVKGVGALSVQVNDYWFERWHVFPDALALGNVLTTQTKDLEIFNAFRRETRTWQGFTNNAGAGITITNLPTLPLDLAGLASFVCIVQISTAGPPVINGTLDFDVDTVFPSIIYVPITGNRITIFPFRPQAPIPENLEFKTDVISLFDGTEQRISLREAPRQLVDFLIRVDDNRSRDTINSILADWQARVFGVPIWWESKPLLADLSPTDTTVQVDTSDADFRAGGLVTVYSSDFNTNTVEILTVNPTDIELQVPIGLSFSTHDTIVMPARTAYTGANLQDARFAIGPTDFQIQFEVLDNIDLSDASAFSTYQGTGQTEAKPFLDGFNFMPGQTVGEGNRRKIIRLDHETGPPVQTSPWAKGKPIYQFGFEAKSAAEVWEIRQLMHYLRGSQLAFYVPSGRKDFKPLLDIPNNSSSIDIVNIGFHQFVEGITPRSDLRVVRTDGTTSLHEISGTSAIDADSERIDVNPAITPALPLADLDRIEIVYLCRIIDDRARFVHMRPGEARVDVQLIGVPS